MVSLGLLWHHNTGSGEQIEAKKLNLGQSEHAFRGVYAV
jgi:hypothetical protein